MNRPGDGHFMKRSDKWQARGNLTIVKPDNDLVEVLDSMVAVCDVLEQMLSNKRWRSGY